MSSYKIIQPSLPLWSDIPGEMRIGKLIRIKGYIPPNLDMSSYIKINLCESQSTVPLHISIRLQYCVVVRNSRQFGSWEKQESDGPFPFLPAQQFVMEILVQPDGYEISVNGRHCWDFAHRLSYLKSTKLHIAGPVRIHYIEYTHKKERGQSGSWKQASASLKPDFYPGQPGSWKQASTSLKPDFYSGQPGSWKQASTSLKPVFNPSVPFFYPITGGIKRGMTISISGKPLTKFHRFTVDLQCGSTVIPPPDIGFRFDVCAFNSTMVRNTRFHEVWQDEETAAPYFPFKPDTPFNITIQIQNDKYVVRVNGQDLISYYHRMSRFSLINTLKIDFDVSLASIEFSEPQ